MKFWYRFDGTNLNEIADPLEHIEGITWDELVFQAGWEKHADFIVGDEFSELSVDVRRKAEDHSSYLFCLMMSDEGFVNVVCDDPILALSFLSKHVATLSRIAVEKRVYDLAQQADTILFDERFGIGPAQRRGAHMKRMREELQERKRPQ